jgi:hypothetical protein
MGVTAGRHHGNHVEETKHPATLSWWKEWSGSGEIGDAAHGSKMLGRDTANVSLAHLIAKAPVTLRTQCRQ